MANDRGAILTVRAAARGVIDFRSARLRDIRWWRRSRLLLEVMHDDEMRDALRAAMAFQHALVGNGNIKPEHFREAQQVSQNLFNELLNELQPWARKTAQDIKQGELANLVDLYRQHVGDPQDPEFRKRLEADIAETARSRQAIPRESDEDRVTRLLAERDQAQAARLQQTKSRRR